ncbi:MAG: pyruvate dehydrogenase complex E1 component subunit beta [bacterium]|nr:pyruvate dehydrogenase complex E1 component subunit beta [bacterium]
MSSKVRKLQYSLAINEAFHQMMACDKSVFLIGQGVKSPWYVGKTALGLLKKFGPERIIDTPVSENAITGAAVGAAIAGMRPIVVHPRMDFMMYAMDPIINEAANWHYMNGGRGTAPVVIWGVINRGGEQGAQHSQSMHALFAHIPGLKVVMPSNSYDAKGLMVSAIKDDNPVVYIDDRWLYNIEGEVPEELYSVPIGKGIIRKSGKDITLVSVSYLVLETLKAAEILEKEGIKAEVIDLRSVKPIDKDMLEKSVKKTGRLLIIDGGWKTCGLAAEISATIAESALFKDLKSPIYRLALPDIPAPSSCTLEKEYYIDCNKIINKVKKIFE